MDYLATSCTTERSLVTFCYFAVAKIVAVELLAVWHIVTILLHNNRHSAPSFRGKMNNCFKLSRKMVSGCQQSQLCSCLPLCYCRSLALIQLPTWRVFVSKVLFCHLNDRDREIILSRNASSCLFLPDKSYWRFLDDSRHVFSIIANFQYFQFINLTVSLKKQVS